MKKQKVLRNKGVSIYLTINEFVALEKAIDKSRLPRSEAMRSFLLSSTYDQSTALSK